MPDFQDATTWGLLAAAAFAAMALLALVGVLYFFGQWWRTRPRPSVDGAAQRSTHADPPPRGAARAGTASLPRSEAAATRSRADDGSRARAARPGPPRASAALDPPAAAGAVRSTILEQVVRRCPAGWTALVLSPPPHTRQMTWHVHLEPNVALDLLDGRTIPTTTPSWAQEWALPAGGRANLAGGDPSPAPGQETKAVRVTGTYLSVTHQAGNPGLFLVRRSNAAGGQHEYRAPAWDMSKLAAALGEGLGGVLEDPGGQALAMGYTPASWAMHERSWLKVGEPAG